MGKRIVVWGRPGVGEVLEEDRQTDLLEKRGELVTLPVDVKLLEVGPLHGYFQRNWGAGIPLHDLKPARVCPMMIGVQPEFSYVHFAVAILADAEQRKRPRGVIRLGAISTPLSAYMGGISAIGAIDLKLDDSGDDEEQWILRGRVNLNVQVEGYLACGLNAVAEGVRVLWSAVTQSSQER